MRAQISTSVSKETRRKADALVNNGGYTYREIVSIGVDRLYAEWQGGTMSTSPDRVTVTAAQMIRPFVGPQWLIEVHPNAEESDADDLAAINAAEIEVLSTELRGWGEYNAVIRVTDGDVEADYLARLA
jgi:hypothetical protein